MFSEKEIILKKEDIRLNRLPLLHKDKNWIGLFGNSEDKDIRKYLGEIIELENEEKELNRLIRTLDDDKKKIIKLILKISDSINTDQKKENIALLDQYKEKLLIINDKEDEVTFRLEMIPEKIREANFQLLNSTVKRGYEEIVVKDKELEETIVELEKINKRMKELVEVKVRNEEWINGLYSFMHSILGGNVIEILDRRVQK